MSSYTAQLLQIIIGFFGGLVLCRGVITLKINDLPDGNRKVQKTAVPSAGGLGIAVAGIAGWVAALLSLGAESLPAVTYSILLLSFAGLLIGLADDMGLLGTKTKLALLLLVCVSAATQLYVFRPYWLTEPDYIPLLDGMTPQPSENTIYNAVLIAGSALWLFVVINAVNFMDGSNGLMAGAVAIMLGGITLVMLGMVGPLGINVLPFLAVIAAVCGFLVWNLAGKLFAGDTGALFLGGVFAAGSLALVRSGDVSVFTPATFALPFLADIVPTVVWRHRRGRNILEAHREHAYQLCVRAGWSHLTVALLWWGGTGVCVVVGIVADMMGGPFPAIAFSAGAVLGVSAWRLQRKFYEPRLGL